MVARSSKKDFNLVYKLYQVSFILCSYIIKLFIIDNPVSVYEVVFSSANGRNLLVREIGIFLKQMNSYSSFDVNHTIYFLEAFVDTENLQERVMKLPIGFISVPL